MIWHTDRDDEDVDVNMVEGHSIGTAGGRWAEPERGIERHQRRGGWFATREANPVASVSTSVPHGSGRPRALPKSNSRETMQLINLHSIYQPQSKPHPPPLKTIHLWSSITHLTSLDSKCPIVYFSLVHQVYYVDFANMLVFTTCVLNCLQSSVQQYSSRAAVCLWQHSIYIPLYHITNNYFQQRLTSLGRVAYHRIGKYFNKEFMFQAYLNAWADGWF